MFVKLQFIAVTGSHDHGAHLGHHQTAVAHFGCEQGNVALDGRRDVALVHHFAVGAIARVLHDAGHEVVVADAVRGGGERMHVHRRRGRKVHARRVGHDHLAVGIDLSKDLRGRVAQNAVEQNAAAGRLRDVDLGFLAHVEALPIDGRALAVLRDGHGGARLGDARAACADLAAHRQLRGGRGQGLGKCGAPTQAGTGECGPQSFKYRF